MPVLVRLSMKALQTMRSKFTICSLSPMFSFSAEFYLYNSACWVVVCRLFLKINFFKQFFQEYYQSVKQFGSRSGRHSVGTDLGPNCLQTKWDHMLAYHAIRTLN